MPRILSTITTLTLCASPALAEVPNVATDIAPIHSLVAQVLGDLGAPTLLMSQGSSPHNYALRPSDARNLQQADVVFWSSDELAPWLGATIDTLAPKAISVPLGDAEESIKINFREGLTFDAHVHGEGEGHVDHDDDHDDHDDAHDDHDDAHDDHDDAHDDHDGHEGEDAHAHEHDHSGIDPHAWLDPQNAIIWLDLIANTLSEIDPEHAQTYTDNAQASHVVLEALIQSVDAQLSGDKDLKFMVFHDAYHYFEARFGLSAMGAISLSDASAPSPMRIAELREKIAAQGVDCVFSEPQFNAGLVDTVLEGTSAARGVIDPMGQNIELGPNFYPILIQGVADSFDVCR
jgi:zinc transport system substrate-binding protein